MYSYLARSAWSSRPRMLPRDLDCFFASSRVWCWPRVLGVPLVGSSSLVTKTLPKHHQDALGPILLFPRTIFWVLERVKMTMSKCSF